MKERRGNFWSDLAAGPIVGTATGLLEFAFHLARGTPLLQLSMLPAALLLYALYWSAMGASVACLLALARKTTGKGIGEGGAGPALVASLAAALTAHAALVTHLFVGLHRPATTLLFALALAAVVPLFFLFRRLVPPVILRRPGRSTATALAAIVVTLPLAALPEPGRIGGGDAAGTKGRGPSILLVVFDTLRFDHTGVYGYDRATTPALDSFAAESVLFERAYAQSPWTLPSTASLLTSLYPRRHGATTRRSALPGDVATLPALLGDAGYRTGLFSGNPYISPSLGFGRGASFFLGPSVPKYRRVFYLPRYLKRTFGRLPFLANTERMTLLYETLWRPSLSVDEVAADELVEAFFRWIDRGNGPFFAHVQIMEPHAPYVGGGAFGPPGISPAPSLAEFRLLPFEPLGRPSDARLDLLVGRYDDDIARADRAFGAIVAGLAHRGLLESTEIAVTADHGEEFWEHGAWGHGQSLHEELIHVPLLFHGPGLAARRIPSLARLVDVAPTLLDFAGVAAPPAFVGRSLRPVLVGERDETGIGEAYAEVRKAARREAWALVKEDGTKLIRARLGDREARLRFRLEIDPGESTNLAVEGDRETDSLFAQLDTAEAAAAAGGRAAVEALLDPVTKRRLRALGYIE